MYLRIVTSLVLIFSALSPAGASEPPKYEPADAETIAAFKKIGFSYVEVKPSRAESMEFASRSGTVFMDGTQPLGNGGLPTFTFSGFRLPAVTAFPPVKVPFGLMIRGDIYEKWAKDLAELKTLTALGLFGVQHPQAKALSALQGLTMLELGSSQIKDADLKELKSLSKLTALGLEGTEVTDAGMKDLRELTNLTTLTLPYKVTGAGVKELATLEKLTAFHIAGSGLTDAGMKEFQGLKALVTLHLGSATITDAGIRELKELKHLNALYLGSLQTPEAPLLGDLKDFPSLTVLSLPYKVKDLNEIRGIKKLSELSMVGCPIVANGGLKDLKGFENLTRLDLRLTKVTDADLKALRALPRLASLTLFNTPVTDAGLAELREIKTLTYLNVQLCKVTPDGVKELQAALPKCVIVR